jgi:hypothetical protein
LAGELGDPIGLLVHGEMAGVEKWPASRRRTSASGTPGVMAVAW